jgi:hypothetical protein
MYSITIFPYADLTSIGYADIFCSFSRGQKPIENTCRTALSSEVEVKIYSGDLSFCPNHSYSDIKMRINLSTSKQEVICSVC